MHKQLSTWQFIHQNLQQNIAVMLLYVIESKGSSPGRQGFMMAVNAAGSMSGSLGGGIMEHKFVELAKATLQLPFNEPSVHKQLHDKKAAKNQSGMICSGQQTIFVYRVHTKETTTIEQILFSLKENKNGSLQLSPQGIIFTKNIPDNNYSLAISEKGDFIYIEKTGYKNKLYIVGGGHCALALSKLMFEMDFYIYLFDDRSGLNTMEQNNFVHEKKVVENFSILNELILSSKNTFVVIMTFGYRTDEIALRTLLGKRFKYIGILGSKNKMKKMFSGLLEDGISAAVLKSIHSPIGLPIKSQTTEEIAISIAAEIIKAKNKI